MSLLDLNHANLTQTLLSRLFQSDIRTWLLDYAQPYKELMAYYRCAMMEVSTKFQVLNEELLTMPIFQSFSRNCTYLFKPPCAIMSLKIRTSYQPEKGAESWINWERAFAS